jgi:PBP1b-binding outer membrane lipoprotein LpoB
MKMSHKFLVLALLALALSGCSSCPCKKKAVETPAPVAQAVTTPAAPAVVQESASATPAEPAEASIPVTTRRYVNK